MAIATTASGAAHRIPQRSHCIPPVHAGSNFGSGGTRLGGLNKTESAFAAKSTIFPHRVHCLPPTIRGSHRSLSGSHVSRALWLTLAIAPNGMNTENRSQHGKRRNFARAR